MATTLERLTKVLVNEQGLPHDIIKPDAALADDLGLDDLEIVNLSLACEDEFSAIIHDDDLEEVRTVGDMVSAIDRAVATRDQQSGSKSDG